MIVRLWRGDTAPDKADSYLEYLRATGVADYQATAGNQGVMVLRNRMADRLEWITLSRWESMEAIRRFAGNDVGRAVYYPEDHDYLLRFEPDVHHYDVVLTAGWRD
jgi:heme-degrading monooxygenase HmoA